MTLSKTLFSCATGTATRLTTVQLVFGRYSKSVPYLTDSSLLLDCPQLSRQNWLLPFVHAGISKNRAVCSKDLARRRRPTDLVLGARASTKSVKYGKRVRSPSSSRSARAQLLCRVIKPGPISCPSCHESGRVEVHLDHKSLRRDERYENLRRCAVRSSSLLNGMRRLADGMPPRLTVPSGSSSQRRQIHTSGLLLARPTTQTVSRPSFSAISIPCSFPWLEAHRNEKISGSRNLEADYFLSTCRWSILIGLVVIVALSVGAWFLSPKGENQTYVCPPSDQATRSLADLSLHFVATSHEDLPTWQPSSPRMPEDGKGDSYPIDGMLTWL